ncbi:RNA polymerase factor sigma-32 [Thiohalorhabdus denitrificans]|uniref:RNA polymerase sigma factor RpoH n=1 Tax=Thiohalorhabdus denitrificans TaxID=381306 RepID=A0A0P9C8G7_9GAMM|nr:RNA polymerase sigma factor RpoH [Thiohalorhabdus denitrificans]KPV39488.1 RNA polymerase factor sigma-32 [Thiohalorhabdus denitrificans]SCY01014.1 RNA polymerase sigma-32 factor [Thiohalorhabdus denitrificans]
MASKSLTLSIDAHSGSLESYLSYVRRLPLLSWEEEQDYARRYRSEEDLEAARALVLSHLRVVVRIARGYQDYGLPFADLIQEGNIGLMKAVKNFDPDRGVRLVSFAVHWIRAEIHEFILRNWRMVKVATTKAQRKLFFNLRKAKKHLSWLSREEARDIADDLQVPEEQVLKMDAVMSRGDQSLNEPIGEDEDGDTRVDMLPDGGESVEEELAESEHKERTGEALASALANLDERSREIIQRRWLTDPAATLQELADELQISAERVRQIERKALTKLQGPIAEAMEAENA